MTAIWGGLASAVDADTRETLVERHGADLIRASNHYGLMMEKLGLKGPFET